MIPKIDADIGISVYTTEFAGCGGKIKENVGDFTVIEELATHALDSVSDDDGYAVYVMRKAGIDTTHALQRVRSRTGQRLKALGLKDARATTEQYVCATSKSVKLAEYSDGDVSLSPVGYTARPLSAKDMTGNAFAITIRDHNKTLCDFTEWDRILNFYAYQRFGSARTLTHLVGRAIITKDWKRATELIMTFVSPYESESATELRQKISECKTYSEMLKVMPHGMDIERIIASSLAERDDPLVALKSLPVQMRRFYVQAYQSYIFNRALCIISESDESLKARDGDVCYGADSKLGTFSSQTGQELAMPLVGHSYYTKTRFGDAIKKIMSEEKIVPHDFLIKDMQEASAEGGFRTVLIRASRPTIESDTVHVALRRGSYATALLREIIKPSDPVTAGLAT